MANSAPAVLSLLRDDAAWSASRAATTLGLALQAIGCRQLEEDTMASSSAPVALDEEFASLTAWMRSGLEEEESLWTFEQHANPILGNGLKAAVDIEPLQHVLSIPKDKMLSAKFAPGRSPAIATALDRFEDNPSLQLAVCLLFHKRLGNQSPFHAYISILPTRFGIPTNWSKRVLEATMFLPCHAKCIQSIRACVALFFRFRETLKSLSLKELPTDAFGWEEFRWAMAVVSTRQNQIPIGEVSCMALVPVWDMMNHEQGPQTTGFDTEPEALEFRSMRAVAKGESLTMCYGHRSNEMLLLYSGFASECNEFDSMDLEINIQRDALSKIRDLLLQNCGLVASNSGFVSVKISREISSECLVRCLYAILVNRATKEQTLAIMKAKDSIKNCLDPNSLLKLCNELAQGLASEVASDLCLWVARKRESLDETSKRELVALESSGGLDSAVAGEVQKLVQGYLIILNRLESSATDLASSFAK